jgi:uncharacterized protein
MYPLIFLFTFLKILLVNSDQIPEAISVSSIPNPNTTPDLCGRKGVPKSAICDPQNLLDQESKDVIEGRINGISELQYGVAIISKMAINNDESIELASERYSRTLHDTWGVGDKDKQNGVLIFLSIEDRSVYISRGAGIQYQLTNDVLDATINGMKPYLRQSNYGRGIEFAILDIHNVITGNHREKPPDGEFSDLIVYVPVLLSIVGIIYYIESRNKKKENELRRGQEALSRLVKEVGSMEQQKFSSSSCPICLEEFVGPKPDCESLERPGSMTTTDTGSISQPHIDTTRAIPTTPLSIRRPMVCTVCIPF